MKNRFRWMPALAPVLSQIGLGAEVVEDGVKGGTWHVCRLSVLHGEASL